MIIGAGASGIICAIEAARRGRSVLVIDHMDSIGSKIRISGGGRCNFSNLHVSSGNYHSNNRDFCRSALAQFRPSDFTELLDRYHIGYREKTDGQLFCTGSSADILNVLKLETSRLGVSFSLRTTVRGLRRDHSMEVLTDRGSYRAASVVVATGGLSYPGLGATGLGHVIARQFGIKVTRLRPGLVPLTFDRKNAGRYSDLSGASLPVEIICRGHRTSGSMLFTHGGLSGPAILRASLSWEPGDDLAINLVPDLDMHVFFQERHHSKILLSNLLSSLLPKRFAHRWVELESVDQPLCRFGHKELLQIAARLHDWRLRPSATGGYEKAEVTVGGVDTSELSSKTMEAKSVPGLYFTGEVIDVTGDLGGYNLQWAWSSGFVAGHHA